MSFQDVFRNPGYIYFPLLSEYLLSSLACGGPTTKNALRLRTANKGPCFPDGDSTTSPRKLTFGTDNLIFLSPS